MLNIGKFCGLYNTRAHNIIYYCNLNITIILINVHYRPLISGYIVRTFADNASLTEVRLPATEPPTAEAFQSPVTEQ